MEEGEVRIKDSDSNSSLFEKIKNYKNIIIVCSVIVVIIINSLLFFKFI